MSARHDVSQPKSKTSFLVFAPRRVTKKPMREVEFVFRVTSLSLKADQILCRDTGEATGTVKWLDATKGFRLIQPTGGGT
jgi:hypothetical protein